MGTVDHAWQAIGLDFDGHHHIQAENGEVVKVIFVERLGAQMGMDATYPLKATKALTDTHQWRDLEAPGIPHHD